MQLQNANFLLHYKYQVFGFLFLAEYSIVKSLRFIYYQTIDR